LSFHHADAAFDVVFVTLPRESAMLAGEVVEQIEGLEIAIENVESVPEGEPLLNSAQRVFGITVGNCKWLSALVMQNLSLEFRHSGARR
jgi:hypothetical protein